MSAGDVFTFESSITSSIPEEVYQSKIWSYGQDTNNGNNPSQLRFSLDGFRSSDKFVNMREAYLSIPLILALGSSSGSAVTGGFQDCDFALAMKCGFHQIIQSMSVMIDNKEVVQITNNLSQYVSWKLVSSLSLEDLKNGADLVYPDSATSWGYSPIATSTSNGVGLFNNSISPVLNSTLSSTASSTGSSDLYNAGAYQRAQTCFRQSGTNKYNSLKTLSNFQAEGKNYVYQSGGSGSANEYIAQYLVATIKLRDLADVFDKLPLVRGINCSMLVNLQLGHVNIVKDATSTMTVGSTTSAVASNIAVENNGSLPFMVTKLGTDFQTSTAGTLGTFTAGLYYGKVGQSGTANQSMLGIQAHSFPVARLYAPQISLTPEKALQYLTTSKKKTIVYRDVLYFYQPNIGSGSSFNLQLAPSINNMKSICVIPAIASTVLGVREDQMPFDTMPFTTSPLSIYNFNIQIASQNVFQQNELYGWEQFIHETQGARGINGGLTDGLTSGLIDFTAWDNIYKYYYVNLGRRLKDDVLGKSISVLGNNNNKLAMDMHIFLEVEKTLIIDVESGIVDALIS